MHSIFLVSHAAGSSSGKTKWRSSSLLAVLAVAAAVGLPSTAQADPYARTVTSLAESLPADLNQFSSRRGSPAAGVKSAAKKRARCFGERATWVGTASDDDIRATQRKDVIVGRGGDDQIYGFGGMDLICGNTGDDTLFGEAGRDKLNGGSGEEIMAGGTSADVLKAGPGDVEALLPGGGDDTVNGGPGVADTVSFLEARSDIRANLAEQRVRGEGKDAVRGIEGIQGSPSDDMLIGDDTSNFLIGAIGGDGDDRMYGRGGLDAALFSFATAPLDVRLVSGVSTGQGTDHINEIEAVAGGPFNDALEGNAEANFFFGGDGDDELVGGDGEDQLDGEAGADDSTGGDGADILSGGRGDDLLDGGPGLDEVSYEDAPESVVVDLDLGGAVGDGTDLLSHLESIMGSSFADDLAGNDQSNLLHGGEGSDQLEGLGGNDSLYGDLGDDLLRSGAGDDGLYGGAGANTYGGDDGTDVCLDPGGAVAAPSCETGENGTPDELAPIPTKPRGSAMSPAGTETSPRLRRASSTSRAVDFGGVDPYGKCNYFPGVVASIVAPPPYKVHVSGQGEWISYLPYYYYWPYGGQRWQGPYYDTAWTDAFASTFQALYVGYTDPSAGLNWGFVQTGLGKHLPMRGRGYYSVGVRVYWWSIDAARSVQAFHAPYGGAWCETG